jgi:hypothetical protein
MSLTETDVVAAMRTYGGEQARFVAKNPKLLKATFDLLKAIESAKVTGGASAVLGGISAAAKATGASQAVQKGVRTTSFTVGVFKSTMDLTKIFTLTSTGAVVAYVGATVIQKTGMAVSLMGDDSEQAKCVGAVMEMSGAIGVAAASAPTGVLLALTVSSLVASVLNATVACKWME